MGAGASCQDKNSPEQLGELLDAVAEAYKQYKPKMTELGITWNIMMLFPQTDLPDFLKLCGVTNKVHTRVICTFFKGQEAAGGHTSPFSCSDTESADQMGNLVASMGNKFKPYKKVIVENGVSWNVLASMDASELPSFFEDLEITSVVHVRVLTALIASGSASAAAGSSSASGSSDFVESVTVSPRKLMGQLFKLQGIPLDPSDIKSAVVAIKDVVGSGHGDGETTYDCFINYRVAADKDTAEKLYLYLKAAGVHAFLDKMCLKNGEGWKEGFLQGLRSSHCFLALISSAGLENVRDISKDHTNDNVLIEYQYALQLQKSKPNFICPIHVGHVSGNTLTKFSDFNVNMYAESITAVDLKAIAEKKKKEEEAAALKKKQEEEAAALKKKKEEEAAALKKKKEEEANAAALKKKKDEEEAAAAKRKKEAELAAEKKRKEEEAVALAKKKKREEEEAAANAERRRQEAVAAEERRMRQEQERIAAQKRQRAAQAESERRQRWEEYEEAFSLFDKYGKGELSEKEVGTCMRALGMEVDKRAVGIVDRMFRDNDACTFEVFARTMDTIQNIVDEGPDGYDDNEGIEETREILNESYGDEEELRDMFRELEDIGNGKASRNSFIDVMGTNLGLDEESAAQLFNNFSENGRWITYNGFLRMLASFTRNGMK